MKKQSLKDKLARASSNKPELDKKVMRMKNSWDEVEKLLHSKGKQKKSK